MILLGWLACQPQATQDAPPTAPELPFLTVNGIAVPRSRVEALGTRLSPRDRAWVNSQRRGTSLVERLVLTTVLAEKARKAGLMKDPEVQARMRVAESDFLASEYVRWAAERRITEHAIQELYEAEPGWHVAQQKLRHIRLKPGADLTSLPPLTPSNFETVAREHSADLKTGAEGGRLGWIDTTVVEQTFGEAVAQLEPGSISMPVAGPGGTHIVWVEAQRDQTPLGEEVRAEIRGILLDKHEKAIQEEAIRSLDIERSALESLP